MTNDSRLELAKKLVKALEQGKESDVNSLLDEISSQRESEMFHEVGRITRQLHDTMGGMGLDANIASITETDIPNAKERLQYVITMTEQAANDTLNVVEKLLPVSQDLNEYSEQLSEKWERFLVREMPFEEFKGMTAEITNYFKESRNALQKVQGGLNDILMAQGFQDITGQIIKKVIGLVQDVESSMVELVRISGAKSNGSKKTSEEKVLPGPVVPGVDDKAGDVVENQDDVDDLLSSLGF
ncbi:MAG: protein phosphatase CheZ [Methylococcaceae bacterium]|nr:protein phosphatase CheZ [Methylococcaceae bacterium]